MDVKVFKRFENEIMRGFAKTFETKLRPVEMHLLTLINRESNKPLHFYARHIGLEKGSFTYVVEVLEEKGYLNRKEDAEDRRRKYLELTDKSLEEVKKFDQAEKEYMDEVLNKFSNEEQKVLIEAEKIMHRYIKEAHEKHKCDHQHHDGPKGMHGHKKRF